jgi:hypothetical protein
MSNNGFRRGLDSLTEPEMDTPHDDKFGELHRFVVRSFRWEGKPEEKDMLESIESIVDNFMEEYINPAEVIIARFNSDNSIGGAEGDRLLLNLQSAIVAIEEEVTRRYLRAQFSYYMLDDKYNASYVKHAKGTTNDLNARARMETRDDRLFYFVQYSAWRIINDKVNSLKATQRHIQNQLYRRSQGGQYS